MPRKLKTFISDGTEMPERPEHVPKHARLIKSTCTRDGDGDGDGDGDDVRCTAVWTWKSGPEKVTTVTVTSERKLLRVYEVPMEGLECSKCGPLNHSNQMSRAQRRKGAAERRCKECIKANK